MATSPPSKQSFLEFLRASGWSQALVESSSVEPVFQQKDQAFGYAETIDEKIQSDWRMIV